MTEQFSIRLPNGTKERLQALADALGRTKSFLVQDAVKKYLETETWQIMAIQEGIKAADDGKVIPYRDIKLQWGIE